ncbi:MAG: SpoIIE family protein phosphatase [Hamadaea sp.]|uniref:PP2C family protein-serine/threonine phosphatase n=1 Tax=Hamadaea sp. TaxID=2024425 RepID=UPI00181A83FE|nr:GAF domain-containing SpoIIE family protein phosphatase [Hamadaea sp.]NUR70910.1 SpoIIE family protein phosphatase [Hamadaea sp.]NUT21697.1 SpoIIE family protein phosphatase [Hamadaea sp.]
MTTSRDPEILDRIRAVTDAELSHLPADALLSELITRTKLLLNVDTATILLLDPSGHELITAATAGLEEELQLDIRVPMGVGFAGRVAASGEPLVIDRVSHGDLYSPVLIDNHVTSMAGVPVIVAGRVVGVLRVGTIEPRSFTEDDIELLRLVADRAGVAAHARLSQTERVATLALQRSLLPARPPQIAGLDMAVRYIPGAEVGVGGDWYDVFSLPSGHVGLVIGDVAGNGLQSAVVMGRIRSALRAYALESVDPADVLTRLDRKIQLFEPGAMATAAYAVVTPDRTSVTFSVAGHLMPVVLEPGAARGHLLEAPVDLPLGALPDADRRITTLAVSPGLGLLLYTDGLVERRRQSIDDGIEKLLSGLTGGDAEELCAAATANMLHNEAVSDDVAVVGVRIR